MIQIIILILSVSSIWLINKEGELKKWAYPIGLAAQPFWMYSSALHAEWGMVALAIFYGYSWSLGTYHNFIKNAKKE